MNVTWTERRVLILLGILLGAAFAPVLFGGQSFFYRDFGVLGVPTCFYQRHAFWSGELPLWNPYSNCGAPFLAQWGTMCLYPPALIYLVLPFPWSLNLFCLLHLWFGGWGMWRLARGFVSSEWAAAFAAVLLVFSGCTLACLSWPNYCAAVGWMPWVVLSVTKVLSSSAFENRRITVAILCSSAQLLTGVPEMVVLTWLITAVMALSDVLEHRIKFRKCVFRGGVIILTSAFLVAAQFVPFVDLLAHSQRAAAVQPEKWSMPLSGWVNLVLPFFRVLRTPQGTYFQQGQYFVSSIYFGALAMSLAIAALVLRRDLKVRLLAGFAVLLILLAFGSNAPVFSAFHAIAPFLSVARYPVKAAFALPLLVSLLAGIGLDQLGKTRWQARFLTLTGLGFVALTVGALEVMHAFPQKYDRWHETLQNSYVRAAFLFLIAALLRRRWQTDLTQRREGAEAQSGAEGHGNPGWRFVLEAAFLCVCFLDLRYAVPNQNPTLNAGVFQPALWQAAYTNLAAPKLGESRLFITPEAEERLLMSSVSDPLADLTGKRLAGWSHLNLLDLLPKVNGSSTLRLRDEDAFQTALYASNFVPKMALDFLGVTVATAPGQVIEWQQRSTAWPLVRVVKSLDFESPAGRESSGTVANVRWRAQEISFDVTAAEPGFVSIAQSYSHNWRVYLDARPEPLLLANRAFQGIAVPAGSHHVRVVYRDYYFVFGAFCSCASVVGLVVLWNRKSGHRLNVK